MFYGALPHLLGTVLSQNRKVVEPVRPFLFRFPRILKLFQSIANVRGKSGFRKRRKEGGGGARGVKVVGNVEGNAIELCWPVAVQ